MSPEHGKGGKKEGCPLIPPLPPGLDHLPVSPPLPPRPPTPKLERTDGENMQGQKQLIKTSLLVTGCMIGGILLAGIVFTIMNKYCSRRNRRRRRNPPAVFETQDDFLDEDHGPVLDHPIWYINAIGLQQSVIDSITVCKYQKDEGLIDGIECSICLSEFEEDETLRLLPKCSHAFHLPCIDTWLRSHKNCPLCRAPILSNAAGSPAAASEPRATASASTQETQVENLGSDQVGEDGTSQVGVRDETVPSLAVEDGRRAEIPKKSLQNSTSRNCHSRVQNNLVDHQRDAGEEILPLRRSVSLDSSSASMIYHAVANVVPDQGSQKSQLVPLKNSSANVAAKPDGGTSSKSKLMQSSSSSRSLQKGPSSMKRSFSSSRKFFSSRQWKSGSSILPL